MPLPGITGIAGFFSAAAAGFSGTPTNITWLGSLPTVAAANGGSVTLTFSNFRDASSSAITLQQNDVVVCAYESSVGIDHAMSTSSTGWTKAEEMYVDSGGGDVNLSVWYKVMGAVPDTSFVGNGSGGSTVATVGVAMAFRGVDTSSPLDVTPVVGSGLATSNPNPPAITAASNGALILVTGGGGGGSSLFAQPGDLSSGTNHFRSGNSVDSTIAHIGMGWTNTWTGTFDPSPWTGATNNINDSWGAIVLALRST